MIFKEVLAQVIDCLQQDKCLSYRALKRQFALDDDYLDDLKAELIEARRIAVDEDGRVLVWTGDTPPASATPSVPTVPPAPVPLAYTPPYLTEKILTSRSALAGERKQVTVLFADLKGSMELLADRDPEEARQLLDPVLQRMMAAVHRYEGTVNQVMGDGIMALFGAPIAYAEQGLALYDTQPHHGHLFLYGLHHGVNCLLHAAHSLGMLGYPEQARQQYHAALTRAQDLAHAFTLVHALLNVTMSHQLRREERATQERAETLIALGTEQESSLYLAWATTLRGWALATQGQTAEGMVQMRQGLAAARATGAELFVPYFLALLAEACGHTEQIDEGLRLLAEALAVADHNAERWYEAELYRLQGELLLARSTNHQTEAESCFQHALNIASAQHAKSWELRAAMSLSRLWQQQGRRDDAHTLLAPIYDWFTEGFDTADLQEAKALLEALTS